MARPVTDNVAQELTWRFSDTPAGPIDVVVNVPKSRGKLPVLIAWHGQGESFKGPARGARGWFDDYNLSAALKRIETPPLGKADLQNLGGGKYLEQLNTALSQQPFRPFIVVTPFTPNILGGDRSLAAVDPVARFVVETLLPKLADETPSSGAYAMDGVSLGGRVALVTGLAHPGRFVSIGAIQPAIYGHELDELLLRFRRAQVVNPRLYFRLLSSTGDFYRGSVEKFSKMLREDAIEHTLQILDGPHDYVFNRGPGAYELLLFHERAFHGESWP